MSIQSDFELKFPELTPVEQSAFDSAVSLYPCIYGAKYCEEKCSACQECENEAILYLVAHLYVLNPSSGISGGGSGSINNVASKIVDDESVSYQYYANLDRNDIFFGTTKYGQIYLMLTQKYAVGGFFV